MVKIPCGKYAVFTSEKGNYAGDELKKMHDLIFNSWLKESKYSIKKEYIISNKEWILFIVSALMTW